MSVTINGTTGISGVAGTASAPALVGSDADSGFFINSANEPSASVNGTAVWNAASTFGFKNRIINGAMAVDQRATAITATGFSVDRWQYAAAQSSKVTAQQNAGSVTPPTGFGYYVGVTSSSAYTPLAADYFDLQQAIEANNFGDFNFGTASASTVAVSFWVRSSLTGLLGGAFGNYAGTRAYPFTFTVNSANTWEYKTVIIPGDTSGTWVNSGTGGSAVLRFDLGNGSNSRAAAGAWTGTSNIYGPTGIQNIVGTNGATFYITGVQLEKGSTATSFDYRSYGTELSLCQRYFAKLSGEGSIAGYWGGFYSTAGCRVWAPLPVVMRTAPSLTLNGTTFERVGFGTSTGTIANVLSATRTVSFDGTALTPTATFGCPASYYGDVSCSSEL